MKKLNLNLIKNKLLLIAASVTIIIVLIGFVASSYINRKKAMETLTSDTYSLIQSLMELKKAQNGFLLKDQNSNDFFETGTSGYIENFEINYRNLDKKLENLLNNKLGQKHNIENRVTIITQFHEDYFNYSNLLVQNIREKGSSNYGIIGELIDISRKLENLLSVYDNNFFIKENLLEIRRGEKVFLTEKDLDFRNSFIRSIDEFQKEIEEFDSELNMPNVVRELQVYKSKFDEVIQKEQDIEVLINETNSRFEQLEKEVNSLIDYVNKKNTEKIKQGLSEMYILVLLLMMAILATLMIIRHSIVSPIEKLQLFISKLVKGEFPGYFKSNKNDEISKMGNTLNDFVDSLKLKVDFAKKIGQGELDIEYTPLSKEDKLGQALLEMQASLKSANDQEEKRKEQEEKNNWITEGIAQFGQILQQGSQDLHELSYQIISKLVGFLDANQAGLFLINDENKEEPFLELMTAIAYDQRKNMQMKVNLKEGLVGTCAIEKATILLDNIPEGYITITSGLGKATPNNLLIVPLKRDEMLLGVIELASFNEFQKHHVNFVETVAENIAVTLSAVKINQRTAELLEQSKKQSEEMASQEEEMRQNLEELQATQESALRREAELNGVLNAINASSLVAEYNLEGNLLKMNDQFLKLLTIDLNDIFGQNHRDLSSLAEDETYYQQLWNDLLAGIPRKEDSKIEYRGKTIWVNETYTPILDESGIISRILVIAIDVSESRKREVEINKLLNESQKKAEQFAAQEEELKIYNQELIDYQENLSQKNEEIEKIRVEEKEKADRRIDTQKTAMVRFMKKARADKRHFKTVIKELEEKIKKLEDK